jgi:hypothetical protein
MNKHSTRFPRHALRGGVLALLAAPLVSFAAGPYLAAGEMAGDWLDKWQQQAETERLASLQTPAAPTSVAEADSIAATAIVTARLSPTPLTRAHVREQLQQAVDSGMMNPVGEMAEPDHVLAARELFGEAQAEQFALDHQREQHLLAENRAEQERRLAAASMRENEVDITAGEALVVSELRADDTPVEPMIGQPQAEPIAAGSSPEERETLLVDDK